MVNGHALKATMPYNAFEMQLMFHSFQFAERASAVERFHCPAGDREAFWVAPAIRGHRIVATHRVFDTSRLDIPCGRQDGRHRHAIGGHDAHAAGVVAVLPVISFLQTSTGQRTKMMMNIEYLHGLFISYHV